MDNSILFMDRHAAIQQDEMRQSRKTLEVQNNQKGAIDTLLLIPKSTDTR